MFFCCFTIRENGVNRQYMHRLRKQIYESFFNPILHFLPLIVFILVDDYWGLEYAWMAALPVVVLLFLYIYTGYRKLLQWFLISTGIFFVIAGLSSVLSPVDVYPPFDNIVLECALLVVFAISIIRRKKVEAFINNRKSRLHSMSNNLNEMFRMIWILTAVLVSYIFLHTLVFYTGVGGENADVTLHTAYVFVLFVVMVYEIIRVTVVRLRLMKEEWWPIVNEQGKMIGSVSHITSLAGEGKYMHPVIRVMVIDENRIFLQKRTDNDLVFAGLWDTAVSNHIRVNETIEQCIARTALESYGVTANIKPLFLTNYTSETDSEFHYAFLFVLCKSESVGFTANNQCQTKWWTLKQIEDNISDNIFTCNFITELELIKRSGLLEQGICECECKLRDSVMSGNAAYKQN